MMLQKSKYERFTTDKKEHKKRENERINSSLILSI